MEHIEETLLKEMKKEVEEAINRGYDVKEIKHPTIIGESGSDYKAVRVRFTEAHGPTSSFEKDDIYVTDRGVPKGSRIARSTQTKVDSTSDIAAHIFGQQFVSFSLHKMPLEGQAVIGRRDAGDFGLIRSQGDLRMFIGIPDLKQLQQEPHQAFWIYSNYTSAPFTACYVGDREKGLTPLWVRMDTGGGRLLYFFVQGDRELRIVSGNLEQRVEQRDYTFPLTYQGNIYDVKEKNGLLVVSKEDKLAALSTDNWRKANQEVRIPAALTGEEVGTLDNILRSETRWLDILKTPLNHPTGESAIFKYVATLPKFLVSIN